MTASEEFEKWVDGILAKPRKRVSTSSAWVPDVDGALNEHIAKKTTGMNDTAHKNPSLGKDGSWACSECGAESFDREQFEEAAEYMNCPGPSLSDFVESEKLAKQITSAREALKKVRPAAENASKILEEVLTKSISSSSSASSVPPMIIRADANDFEKIKHITWTVDPADSSGSSGVLFIPEELKF